MTRAATSWLSICDRTPLALSAAPCTSVSSAATWSGSDWIVSDAVTLRTSEMTPRISPGSAWVSSLASSVAVESSTERTEAKISSIGRLLIRSSVACALRRDVDDVARRGRQARIGLRVDVEFGGRRIVEPDQLHLQAAGQDVAGGQARPQAGRDLCLEVGQRLLVRAQSFKAQPAGADRQHRLQPHLLGPGLVALHDAVDRGDLADPKPVELDIGAVGQARDIAVEVPRSGSGPAPRCG